MTDKFTSVLQERVDAMRVSFEEKLIRIDTVQMDLKNVAEQTQLLKVKAAELEKPEVNQLKIAELNYMIGEISSNNSTNVLILIVD